MLFVSDKNVHFITVGEKDVGVPIRFGRVRRGEKRTA